MIPAAKTEASSETLDSIFVCLPNGEQQGPRTTRETFALWKGGKLPEGTLYWQPPLEDWRPIDVTGPFRHPGFFTRLVAALLDGLIFLFVLVAIVILVSAFESLVGASQNESLGNMAIWGTCAWWLYFGLFESSRFRATPGKMACGIIVTDMKARRIGFDRATGRCVSKSLYCLPFLIAGGKENGVIAFCLLSAPVILISYANSSKKRFLHDLMAGCVMFRA